MLSHYLLLLMQSTSVAVASHPRNVANFYHSVTWSNHDNASRDEVAHLHTADLNVLTGHRKRDPGG